MKQIVSLNQRIEEKGAAICRLLRKHGYNTSRMGSVTYPKWRVFGLDGHSLCLLVYREDEGEQWFFEAVVSLQRATELGALGEIVKGFVVSVGGQK